MTLYLVPTPIGNLEDITLRGLRILREVRLIAAEDTRTTRNLLNHYQIATPLTSYHEHNRLSKLDAIFSALAEGDVALVSDAGTPGINDPGYELVVEALARGIRIEPLPGACAAITGLVASGLPTEQFHFLGFVPKKDKARRAWFEGLQQVQATLIAYESPNRLVDTLIAAHDVLGDRPACVAREITKMYEEFFRGTLSQAAAHYQQNPPRGEIVLLIHGAVDSPPALWDEETVRSAVRDELLAGASTKDAAAHVAAASGWDRRTLYELALTLKRESS